MNDRVYGNSTKRLPVVMCLDVSPSMGDNRRMEHLNKAVSMFLDSLRTTTKVISSTEIAMVTFSTGIEMDTDFRYVDQLTIPTFTQVRAGGTNMAIAIRRALEKIQSKLAEYERSEIEYYIPILVVITDGNPDNNDDLALLNQVTNEIQEVARKPAAQRIIPFIAGVGDQVVTERLDLMMKGFSEKALIIDSSLDEQEDLFKSLFKLIGNSITNSIRTNQTAEDQIKSTQLGMQEFHEKTAKVKRKLL